MSQSDTTLLVLGNSPHEAYSRNPWSTRLASLIFSFVYAFVLQALPLTAFLDRDNYLNYAEFSDLTLLGNLASGVLSALFNEPLWLLINAGLSLFLTSEEVVRAIIFGGAFTFSVVILRANPRHLIWLMVFLLTSTVLKNYITHLRQGLAMSVFFLGYFSRRRAHGWVFMGLSPFIHASFFLILPIVLLPIALERLRLAVDIRLLVLAGFSIASSLFLGGLSELVNARQGGQYDFEMTNVSGLGFAFWFGIAALLATQGLDFVREHQTAFGILVFYLVSYFFLEVTARIFESGLPIVLLAGLALAGWRRYLFISAYLSYSVLQWAIRLNSPTPF